MKRRWNVSLVALGAMLLSALAPAAALADDPPNAINEDGKIWVCKYVQTPDGDSEVLASGKQPREVAPSSWPEYDKDEDYVPVGASWGDAQSTSLVIAPLAGGGTPVCPGAEQTDEVDIWKLWFNEDGELTAPPSKPSVSDFGLDITVPDEDPIELDGSDFMVATFPQASDFDQDEGNDDAWMTTIVVPEGTDVEDLGVTEDVPEGWDEVDCGDLAVEGDGPPEGVIVICNQMEETPEPTDDVDVWKLWFNEDGELMAPPAASAVSGFALSLTDDDPVIDIELDGSDFMVATFPWAEDFPQVEENDDAWKTTVQVPEGTMAADLTVDETAPSGWMEVDCESLVEEQMIEPTAKEPNGEPENELIVVCNQERDTPPPPSGGGGGSTPEPEPEFELNPLQPQPSVTFPDVEVLPDVEEKDDTEVEDEEEPTLPRTGASALLLSTLGLLSMGLGGGILSRRRRV